jgi:hypothetical protein
MVYSLKLTFAAIIGPHGSDMDCQKPISKYLRLETIPDDKTKIRCLARQDKGYLIHNGELYCGSSPRRNGRGRALSSHLTDHCGSSSRPGTLRPPSAGTPGGTPVLDKHHSNRALGRPRRLQPGVIGRNHRHPHRSDREAL